MKHLVTTLILFSSVCLARGQQRFESISISYYGEMITHPGIKFGLDYRLSQNVKEKSKKDRYKTIYRGFVLTPTVGFFYHKRYQTAINVVPEIKYTRSSERGGYFETGLGLGYMRTFVPNTFTVSNNYEVQKTVAGHNLFASTFFFAFGKNITVKDNIPMGLYIKPQYLLAAPNFPTATSYFLLEIGIKYKLK